MSSPEGLYGSILLPVKNNRWIEDINTTQCTGCKVVFSIIVRKHHCRYCGYIFCAYCVQQKIHIPDYIVAHEKSIFSIVEERVCRPCYKLILEQMKLHEEIDQLMKNPTDIEHLPDHPTIQKHYFEQLRKVQYYLPQHVYSETDRKLLSVNIHFLRGHSKYVVHSLKAIDWKSYQISDSSDEEENDYNFVRMKHPVSIYDSILTLLCSSISTKNCQDLFCTRTCSPNLDCGDYINILFSTYNDLPKPILEVIFSHLYEFEESFIQCYLYFFVHMIKTCLNYDLFYFIYQLIKPSCSLLNCLYWIISSQRSSLNMMEADNVNRFFLIWDGSIISRIHASYSFFVALSSHTNDVSQFLKDNFNLYKDVYLPWSTENILIQPIYEQIVVKTSKSRPVIIPFKTNQGSIIKVLIKNENVDNDNIVLSLMSLMNRVLKKTNETVTYFVSPITSTSGIVEMVDHAETIHSIQNNGLVILQYIIQNNEKAIISDILDRYTHSLACYTLHSYFLGVGDRHLENIMMTTDGRIFHIDFGYILGKDSQPISSSQIKLNTGMLDVIYGKDSVRYEQYKKLCLDSVVILRKYFADYFILLSQLSHVSSFEIETFIEQRFKLRQSDTIIKEELNSMIDRSQSGYLEHLRDFLHYHTQEKTVQNFFLSMFR